jgi:alpha-N-arabinofuranosidase
MTWPDAASHGRDLPQFADKVQGAREAAAWVEYCNGDATTEGGRMRMANGRVKPYGVKYWEIDNEIHRWFSPEEYAETCVLYARTMKAVDPTIKIGMVSYCYEFSDLVDMLEIAGGDIDFFADRGFDEQKLERKLDLIDVYNRAHGTHIKYCNTEWLPLDGADIYNMAPRKDDKRTKCYLFSKWGYALDAASNLMMWQRHGDIIDFINFNNLANTHAQSAIETPKEGAFVTAAGEMLRMFATTRASRPLKCEANGEVYHPERNDDLQLQLSLTEAGDALVLSLLNRSAHSETLDLDLSAYAVADRGEGTVLTAPDSLSMNTLDRRDIQKKAAEIEVEDGVLEMTVEPLSYGEYVIPLV